MKKTFPFTSCLLLLLFFTEISAQNWGAYHAKIDSKGLEGLRYRAQAKMKAEIVDDSAAASLVVRIFNKEQTFSTNISQPIRSKDWKSYTLEGRIDSNEASFILATRCDFNGNFYFDDLKVEVEVNPNQWKTVFFKDFEDQKINPFIEGSSAGFINKKYSPIIFQENNPKKNQCLRISGKGVPNFGMNSKAGKYENVNGNRIYYEVYGVGKPLVILPYNGFGMAGYSREIEYFQNKKYKIIAIEPRNSPKNWSRGQEISHELMASDVNEVLKKLGIDSAYVIANDQVGFYLAQKYPDKVRKMAIDEFLIQEDTFAIEPGFLQMTKNNFLTVKDERVRNSIGLQLNAPNIPFSDLEKIQTEILLTNVDWDGYVRLSHSMDILKHLPQSNLFVAPGGYDVNAQNPELRLKAIENFFERPFTGRPVNKQ